ncbi:DUF2939 domain-containing protein [uncultured Hydrogenophaga sp.]|uniref:DUF2939 domain-containing protein n=1 Tax=uncultured Hydrogenophaga sp. TaxID=199683 RepID=UPI00265EBD0F|nr:DUF2939 domain-containing protein [uncultured Hydrogenophaga sp.]
MKNRLFAAALALLLIAVGGYWYYSPYLAIRSMQQAADAGDADRFNQQVDYPALRESLKGQMTAAIAPDLDKLQDNPFSALGASLGMAVVNQLVDALVRPEVVMRMLAERQAKPTLAEPRETPASQPPSPQAEPVAEKRDWQLVRLDSDRVVVFQEEQPAVTGGPAGLVFIRSGFADWRLTEIRLPRDR